MANRSQSDSDLPINGHMLKWAREWRNRSIEDAAKKVNASPDSISSWEAGEKKPSVRQARALADFYERPFLEFFLSAPPPVKETKVVPDFRTYKGADTSGAAREIQAIQEWAETQRLNVLDLEEILDETPSYFPPTLHADTNQNPDAVADLARLQMSFSTDVQMSLTSRNRMEFPKILRKYLDDIGVLTLKESRLKKYNVRGLCIYVMSYPIIVYSSESPATQSFTMAHELGHIVLQQSAISGTAPDKRARGFQATVERWCNRFAAAFLMPASVVNSLWPRPNVPQDQMDDDDIAAVANRFAVSRHAALIRLIDLKYVSEDFYWNQKRQQFLDEEDQFRAFGRPSYYGSRYRSALGDKYTKLVLSAWSSGRITNHNAAEFMGIKNLRHLYDVQREYQP